MKYSRIGQKITSHSGIMQLMDDLGEAMTLRPQMRMLGGGNPAAIPAVQELWRSRTQAAIKDGTWDKTLVNYDPPRGNPRFLDALAEYLQTECGWNVTPKNLAVTTGGQTAFFLLFNIFGGIAEDGTLRKVLVPLSPEYIGYCDQGLAEEMFVSVPAKIENVGEHEFKYRVDFAAVERIVDEQDIGAICVSRPTNPSGNVLTPEEISRLAAIAKRIHVPLIVDNAYGNPFPGVIFDGSTVPWTEDQIFTLSLSKLGLPGTRTGIVVASEEIASRIAQVMAVLGLANTNIGQTLVTPMLEDRSMTQVCKSVVRPYYAAKSEHAREQIADSFGDRFAYRLHSSEGAFFLWLTLPELPVTTMQLYERLKERDVIVVPGEYFFFGLSEDWAHRHQCLRLSFAQDEAVVSAGIREISDCIASLSAN